MADNFTPPPRPYPEHAAAVDKMLADVRAECLKLISRKPPRFLPYMFRGFYGKLSDKDRQEIAELGYTLTAAEIGELYGVTSTTVSRIRAKAGLQGAHMGGIRRRKAR